MSSSQLNSITQDRQGYLWIGSNYGLMRFDGNTFKTMLHSDNNPNSIVDNRILKVLIDSDDRVMLATANGLQSYDQSTNEFTLIPLPDKNFNGYISDICELSSGDMLCVASGVGVYLFESSKHKLVPFTKLNKLKWLNQLFNVVECSPGCYLFSSQQGEVAVLDRSGKLTEKKLCSAPILDMVKDKYGDVIIISHQQVWRYDVSRKSFIDIKYDGELNFRYRKACSGRSGIMYISTAGGGIKQLLGGDNVITDCNKWISSTINMATARLNVICEDKDANLWVGCSNKGILMAANRPNQFRHMNLNNIMSDMASYIQDLTYDKQGYLWCSMEDLGVYKFSQRGEMLLHVDTTYPFNRLYDCDDTRLIAGVNNKGIYSIDKATGRIALVAAIDGMFNITAVTADSDGDIFAAVDGRGIVIVDGKSGSIKWLYPSDYEEMINSWIPTLCVDSHKRLWMGHYSGFSCYDIAKQQFKKVTLDDGLRQGVCNDIVADGDSRIWMATSQGLLQYDVTRDKIERFTYDNGLGDNEFLAVAVDRCGNVWATSRSGMNKFDISSHKFTAFYGGHGMDDASYSRLAINDSRTRISFAGANGVTMFEPEKILATKIDTKPVISDLLIKGVAIDQRLYNRDDVFVKDEDDLNWHINLDYTENAIALTLSTLDFRDAKNVSYQYKLNKSSNEWISTNVGENVININNLMPGDYKMQIRACENGVYSPVTEIEISVAAPWFLTTWAKLIYLLILILVCRQLYVAMRRKRDNQIKEAKLQFFINISHEIRSPMTLILSPLEALMKQEFDAKTKQRLNTIHRNATRILGLVNQLLDVRKIDKGKMEIHCGETELVGFINEFTEMFRPKAEAKQIALSFDSSVDKLNVWIDRHNFDKVLVNLLTNAFKYTPTGGNIRIELSEGSDAKARGPLRNYAMIRVIDSGIGIDEKKTEKIFERFYQDNTKMVAGESVGFGIGLNLCRLLMQLHHGSIRAYNRTDGQGSCFEVKLPLGDAHLTEAEKQLDENDNRQLVEKVATTENEVQPTKRVRHRNNYRVLVVDDDSEIRTYLTEYFSEYYKVEAVADGETAWKYILDKGADLVISDINMPGINGFKLLKNIKGNSNTNHIPVVLLTSLTDYNDRKEGWERGADAYLAKPFNGEELLAIADSLIDNRIVLKGHFSGAQSVEHKIDKIEVKSNDDVLMDKVVSMINQHIDDPNLNIEMIGQEVGISRAHLHRKMKDMVGLSPSDFVRTIRLRKACEILRSTDNDVTQVAYSVGFTSQTHFSTAFKKFMGVSPSEYRANQSSAKPQNSYLTESSNSAEGHS